MASPACGIPAIFLRPGGFMTDALDRLPTIRAGGYDLDPVRPGPPSVLTGDRISGQRVRLDRC